MPAIHVFTIRKQWILLTVDSTKFAEYKSVSSRLYIFNSLSSAPNLLAFPQKPSSPREFVELSWRQIGSICNYTSEQANAVELPSTRKENNSITLLYQQFRSTATSQTLSATNASWKVILKFCNSRFAKRHFANMDRKHTNMSFVADCCKQSTFAQRHDGN